MCIVAQRHPAESTGVRRDRVFGLDLVPGVFQGTVAKHAGQLLALVDPAVVEKHPLAVGVINELVPALRSILPFFGGVGGLHGRVPDFHLGVGGKLAEVHPTLRSRCR